MDRGRAAGDLDAHLEALYGEQVGGAVLARLERLVEDWRPRIPARAGDRAWSFTERDAVLITYADMVREPDVAPLRSLAAFCERHLAGAFSFVHILPFYPSSSDEGFAVIDYRSVDPGLGSWEDVAKLRARFRLMLDAVFNHVSARSRWFEGFLRDDPKYRDYFITVAKTADVSLVTRPRTLPLLTPIATLSGEKHVWTTFSSDQVDLNFANPEVLLETVDALLFYAAQGAELIRLDAVAFLWKEIGTSCVHLPQTHRIIQLYRSVLDRLPAHVALVTETNVSHEENVSYFGDGTNEAQMVYNFALPPLVLNAFHTGSAAKLSGWAEELTPPSEHTTFLNFLASHDGIGLNAARGILSEGEVQALVDRAKAHGGLVSYRTNRDGSASPYELNISYFDALSDPRAGEPDEVRIDRMVGAHAIALALPGVPGIYFHSALGSTGWREGVALTGSNRSINRQRCDRAALEAELRNAGSRRSRVLTGIKRLLEARAANAAFHPAGSQQAIDAGDGIFALLRTAPGGKGQVLCLQNVTGKALAPKADLRGLFRPRPAGLRDLITGAAVRSVRLGPYKTSWLEPVE